MNSLDFLQHVHHLVLDKKYVNAADAIEAVEIEQRTKSIINCHIYCCVKIGDEKKLRATLSAYSSISPDGMLPDNHADLSYLKWLWFLYPPSVVSEIIELNQDEGLLEDSFFERLERELLQSERTLGRYINDAYDGYMRRNISEYGILKCLPVVNFPYKYLSDYRDGYVRDNAGKSKSISFIYCIKNRNVRTTLSVRSLVASIGEYMANAEPPQVRLEIIIVEDVGEDLLVDFPTDGAYELITHYLVDTQIGWTRSGLLNYGLKRASCDVVAFCDADFLFTASFVKNVVGVLTGLDVQKNVLAVNCIETEVHKKSDTVYSKWSPYGYMWLVGREMACGIGGFDESYRGHGFEDRDFERRLVDRFGLQVVSSHHIESSLVVLHLSHSLRVGHERRSHNRQRYLGRAAPSYQHGSWGEQRLVRKRVYANPSMEFPAAGENAVADHGMFGAGQPASAAEYKNLYSRLRKTYPDMPQRFELIIRSVYERILVEGDVAIDCGAHTGKHTLPMAVAVGGTGRVFAFEANGEKARRLLDHAEDAGCSRQINVFVGAVGNENLREISFFVLPDMPGRSALVLREDINADKASVSEVRVPMIRLDDYLSDHTGIKFIKTDVEGAELNVLNGAYSLIDQSRPIIHFECGGVAYRPFGVHSEDFFDFFDSIRYTIFDIIGNKLSSKNEWLSSDAASGVYDYIAIPKEHPFIDEAQGFLRQNVSGVFGTS